jgi:integral membrane protein
MEKENMGHSIRTFEVVAALEGLSYLALLGVAMPLKYVAGIAMATRVVGLMHGLLFLAYAVVLLDLFTNRRLPYRTLGLGILAGALPAGSFFFARYLRRNAQAAQLATGAS